MKKITADMLARDGASESQVALVRATWPDGVEPTAENLRAAAGLGLDICWLERYIPAAREADYRAKFPPLDADYRAKRAALEADYKAKLAALLAEALADFPPDL